MALTRLVTMCFLGLYHAMDTHHLPPGVTLCRFGETGDEHACRVLIGDRSKVCPTKKLCAVPPDDEYTSSEDESVPLLSPLRPTTPLRLRVGLSFATHSGVCPGFPLQDMCDLGGLLSTEKPGMATACLAMRDVVAHIKAVESDLRATAAAGADSGEVLKQWATLLSRCEDPRRTPHLQYATSGLCMLCMSARAAYLRSDAQRAGLSGLPRLTATGQCRGCGNAYPSRQGELGACMHA